MKTFHDSSKPQPAGLSLERVPPGIARFSHGIRFIYFRMRALDRVRLDSKPMLRCCFFDNLTKKTATDPSEKPTRSRFSRRIGIPRQLVESASPLAHSPRNCPTLSIGTKRSRMITHRLESGRGLPQSITLRECRGALADPVPSRWRGECFRRYR